MKVICYLESLDDMILAMRTAKRLGPGTCGGCVYDNGEAYWVERLKSGTIKVQKERGAK